MSFRNRCILLLSIAFLLLSIAGLLRTGKELSDTRFAQITENAQKVLQGEIISLNQVMNNLEGSIAEQRLNERKIAEKVSAEKIPSGSSFYFFENERLRYWSDNKAWIDSTQLKRLVSGKLNFIGNGWYYVNIKKYENRSLIGILIIKHQYLLQNQYLVNGFNSLLNLPSETHLITSPASGTFAITDAGNRYLFSVDFTSVISNESPTGFSAWLFAGGILFILLSALDAIIHLGRKKSKWGFLLLLILLVIRLLMVEFQFPGALYESELFSPKYYASSFLLNSLGDLLISVYVFALLIIFLYNFFNRTKVGKASSISQNKWSVIVVFIFLITFLFSVLINYLLSGLIINSQISFNIGNVFELSGYSLIGMMIIGILLLSLYLICDSGIQFIRKTNFKFAYICILFLISQGFFLTLLLYYRNTELFADYGVSAFLLANSLILFISYVRGNEGRLFSFSRTVLVIFAFSIYAAQMIYTFNNTKEKEKRQLFAARLENEQDLVAEYLFEDIETRVENDRSLQNFYKLDPQSIISNPVIIDDLNQRLIRQYFSGYLGRYEISFKYFTANDIPINRAGDPTWNLDEFKESIEKISKPTYSNHFFFIPNSTGRISYLGKINITENNTVLGIIIVELNSRFVQEESGFPDLLLSSKVGAQHNNPGYSYARYLNGKLVNQYGTYNYYLTAAPYEEYFRSLSGMRFSSFDHYSHLFYRFSDSSVIIVSTPAETILVFITLFSYIFTCFSLAFLCIYVLVRWIRSGFRLEINFKSRIQVTIVSIVVATLVLIGVSTITYIYRNYEQAQNTRVREKLNNVLVLVQNELSNRYTLGHQLSDDLMYAFSQLANTLSVDFNIYSLSGQLLYSSQSKIYEQELIAPLMNRQAFQRLTSNQRALFIQNENIGKLSYTAAYEPIRNSDNKTIGYLSLPYFAKETELKRDISSFLVALINIYVFLFSIAIALAFFISNRITQPLRIIQQSLKQTKLGSANTPIVWKQKDEIGALINEYNRMLDALHQSADLLAKSERESAWREMAKQVAHEIKNPLTPMKLGVQHVQRALMDDHPNKEEMVKKLCITLIEQIDTLSNIATEFSHFAKMPKPDYTRIELNPVLTHTVDLYRESEGIKIHLNIPTDKLEVKADRDQLLRIFSNLVKNAVQAIPDEREGEINIDVVKHSNTITISIKDNGQGIPKELVDKIFVPNFTTKTGGTGLGLAMVKNMIESMGGEVWFTTEEGTGTVFYVKLFSL